MFERFTDRARKAMSLSNQEAHRLNYDFISTEHILLGIIKENQSCAAAFLKYAGIDLKKVRLEVEKLVKIGTKINIGIINTCKLPQTPRAKKVIEYAIEEARNLNHNYVGTEHLLLGLLREQDGVAARVLTNLGLNINKSRSDLATFFNKPKSENPDEGYPVDLKINTTEPPKTYSAEMIITTESTQKQNLSQVKILEKRIDAMSALVDSLILRIALLEDSKQNEL